MELKMGVNINNIRYAIMNCTAWVMIGFYMFYLKSLRVYKDHFPVIQEVTYGDAPRSSIEVNIDILYFYAGDILLFLLGSFILIAAHLLMKRKILIPVQVVLTLLVIALLYANQHSWGTVAQYLNFSSAHVAATFALEAPSTALAYINLRSVVTVLLFMLGAVIMTIWSRWLADIKFIKVLIIPVYCTVTLFLVAGLIGGFFSKLEKLPVMASFLGSSVVEIIPSFKVEDSGGASNVNAVVQLNFAGKIKTAEELQSLKTSLGINGQDEHDLIVFVLETAPARFMPLKENLSDYPSLLSLSDHGLIGNRHYAAYPASSEAFSAMIFGNYPPENYYQTCLLLEKIKENKRPPGLVADLEAKGYKTAVYAPYELSTPLDKFLHGKSGFSKASYPDFAEDKDVTYHDKETLKMLLSDIEKWTNKDQRYAAFFLPQLGHGPWLDRKKNMTIIEHGRAMTIKQDKWIGEIIALLKKQGRLEKTTIVITGDHGVRTPEEDPTFAPGKINDYSFHVPLFIYSSQILGKNYIDAPTSHIDIAPTLGVLHNLSERKENDYIGMPIWAAKGTSRNIFFPGGWYFSSDGFLREDQFYMSYSFLGLVYQNDEMNFLREHITQDAQLKEMVQNKLELFYSYQNDRIEKICDMITR